MNFLTHFSILTFILCFASTTLQAQRSSPADSLKREILQLQVDVESTQNNLRLYGKSFRRGILTSAIGYSIVITGGVLLGTDNLADWGQPLIFAGGVIGFGGAIMLYGSNRFLLKAAESPPLPANP
jgi:hypothetical protein